MTLNKAILAASVIIGAIAIIFAYSQFNDFDFNRVPTFDDFVQTSGRSNSNSNLDREGLNESAFQIGQVRTVEASDTDLTLPELFARVEKSVVQITDSHETDLLASRLGSGFVYDTNGHIITNYHVVNGGGRLDVTFLDGTVYRASLIGSDPYTDLAVLYVE